MDEPEDIKTTVLTNLPIVSEETFPEHILPDDLGVFDNSDGNLTINTVQQVVDVAEPGQIIGVKITQEQQQQQDQLKHEDSDGESNTVYIMQIGEPAEDMEEGEYEEYELCTEEEEGNTEDTDEDEDEEEEEEAEDEEQKDSLVDDPTYGEDEEEQERYNCETCNRNFKTAAVRNYSNLKSNLKRTFCRA